MSRKRRVPSLSSPDLHLDETTLLTERRRSGPASVELRCVQNRRVSYEGTWSREKEELGIRGGWEFGGKTRERRKGKVRARREREAAVSSNFPSRKHRLSDELNKMM